MLPTVVNYALSSTYGTTAIAKAQGSTSGLIALNGTYGTASPLSSLNSAVISNQLRRTSCDLKLPQVHDVPLSGREVWAVARAANLSVGTFYRPTNSENYELGLAGGFPITEDGVIVTCYHVVAALLENPKATLVVVNEKNEILPVKEVLAASAGMDLCLLRVTSPTNFQPLPLQTNVFPGDHCYCYSAPYGIKGFFSDGIINRFEHPLAENTKRGRSNVNRKVTRIIVSTDWAQGSSGSALLDNFGNAIGYVRAIKAMPDKNQEPSTNDVLQTLLVIHEGVSAKDVLSVIGQKK
jgi:S1-C subfamily serine protease